LGSEHAATALSDREATRTAWCTEVAFARENNGNHHPGPIQGREASVRDPWQRTKPLRGGPKATARDRAEGPPLDLSPSHYSPRFPSLGTPVLTAPVQTRLRSPIMKAVD